MGGSANYAGFKWEKNGGQTPFQILTFQILTRAFNQDVLNHSHSFTEKENYSALRSLTGKQWLLQLLYMAYSLAQVVQVSTAFALHCCGIETERYIHI